LQGAAITETSLVGWVAGVLRARYPELSISNADARRVVIAGAVRLNGRVVTRPGLRVKAADRLSVTADPSRLARTRRQPAGLVPVLFQDADVIAVDKPAGLAMHATADPQRPHLVGAVAGQLGVPPSALGVHQRLDTGTSGVVLLARSPAANRGLARAFETRSVEKVYLALVDVSRRPDLSVGAQWTETAALSATGSGRRGRRVQGDAHLASEAASEGERHGEARQAETRFVLRSRRRDRALIEARPRTGRQHQIRAHLSAAQLPILGDTRYGGPPAARLYLHAWRIALAHPVTGAPLAVEAPPPAEFR
jgi:23S rRNA-/tRNA-specific pseudouridylate synthase